MEEKVKSSPAEQMLIRWISFVEEESDELEIIRERNDYDWSVFSEWKDAYKCRYAVEMVISNVLDEKSSVRDKAILWLKAQTDRKMIKAVALYMAGLSRECLAKVYTKILFQYDIKLGHDETCVWERMKYRRSTWSEIVITCRLTNYVQMIPHNKPDLQSACRRLMRDPMPENLQLMIVDLFQTEQIQIMPSLRKRILETAIWGTDEMYELVVNRIPMFVDEIVNLLTSKKFLLGEYGFQKEHEMRRYKRVIDLTGKIGQYLENVDDEEGTRIADQLLRGPWDHQTNWIWSIAKEICKFIENKNEVLDYLMYVLNSLPHTNFPWSQENYRDEMRENEKFIIKGFLRVFNTLEPEIIVKFINSNHLVGHVFKEYVGEIFTNLIKENPETYVLLFSPLFQEYHTDTQIRLAYLDAVGFDRAKDDLVKWLKTYTKPHRSESIIDSETLGYLIKNYIVPNGISAGNLLGENVGTFAKSGYKLLPEDVDTLLKVHRVLPRIKWAGADHEAYNKEIWQNEAWREVLLDIKSLGKEIIVHSINSLIEVSGKIWFNQDLANCEKILITRCQENPDFLDAMHLVAWSLDDFTTLNRSSKSITEMSRLILVKNNLYQNTLENKARMQKYFDKKHYSKWFLKNEREVAESILTYPEMANIYFKDIVNDNSGDKYSINDLDKISYIFKETSHENIANWLFAHRKNIRDYDFLLWVKHFNLKEVKNLKKELERCLESDKKNVVQLALEILKA